MGAAEQRQKSQKTAEDMKRRGIKRSSGSCPWGCGAQIANGGPALLTHLNRCEGGGKKRFRTGAGTGKRRR